MLRGACFYTDFIKRSICLGTIIAAVPQLRIQANRKLQIACRTLLGLTPLIFPDPFDFSQIRSKKPEQDNLPSRQFPQSLTPSFFNLLKIPEVGRESTANLDLATTQ